jgi:hypothetical protein
MATPFENKKERLMVDYESVARQSPKAEGTAQLLDFFLPGAGHIYGTAGEKGVGLLVANILCAITVPFVYVTFIVNIILWIYALATATSVTRGRNSRIIEAQNMIRSSAQDAQQEEARKRAAQQDMKQRAEAEQRTLVTGREVALELSKLDVLRKMKVVAEPEFQSKKGEFIVALMQKKTRESMADFFMPLGQLFESNVIDQGDIDALKKLYAVIATQESR